MSEEQAGKGRRRSRAEAAQLVREFEASGLGREEFCRERGPVSSALASGVRIEIALGFDARTLQHLLRVLAPAVAPEHGSQRAKRRRNLHGPGSEKLSNAQLELLELEPGVSNSEVQAESERPAVPVAEKRKRKHP